MQAWPGSDARPPPERNPDGEKEILKRITDLAEEEHRLERGHAEQALAEDGQQRLRSIEVALDQCWDLLRQRRARRAAGQDPDAAQVRPPSTVERYQK